MKKAKKTSEELAFEVLDGQWGEKEEREKNIEEAGYDYGSVEKIVDQKLGVSKPTDTKVFHNVRTSDTLDKIAKTYETSVEEIRKLNNLTESDYIFAGNQIRVK